MDIKFTTKKKIQRALFLSAPFFLSIIAIFFFSIWGFNKFVRNNVFYNILTNTDALNANSVSETFDFSDAQQEDFDALRESLAAENTTEPVEVTTNVYATEPYYVPDDEVYNDPEYYYEEYEYENGNQNKSGGKSGGGSSKPAATVNPADYSIVATNEPFPPIFYGEKFGTISIPAANVKKVALYHGDSDSLLKKGVGHDTNSTFPGQRNGRIVIPGHVGYKWAFQRLEKVKVGDLVYIDVNYARRYVYKVREIVIFDENDPTYIRQPKNADGYPLDSGEPSDLICYTCYPYRTSKVRTQRLGIICDMISGYLYPEVNQ